MNMEKMNAILFCALPRSLSTCSQLRITNSAVSYNREFPHPKNAMPQICTRNISTSVVNCSQKESKMDKSPFKLKDFDEESLDKGEQNPHVIYTGMLNRQMKHVKIFSITTSVMGLWMQPVIYQNTGEHGMAAMIAALGMVGFFTYVTPFLIHMVCKKYVTEIIYDPKSNNYTAVTANFFLRRKEIRFQKEDVIIPEVPGPFTTAVINTKDGKKPIPLFFTIESFKYPKHFGLLMGYDKPIDLHMSVVDFQEVLRKKNETKENVTRNKANLKQ
jgi:transmembrane protein 70